MAEDGKFRIEKFDGTYFSWWRMQIEDFLVQKDLDVVLGDKPEKMSDADWAGLDRKTMSVIRLSLTKNVTFNILKEKTAKGIMDALSDMYEKPSATNKVFLIRELVNTKMKEGTSVTEHINKLNSILARLLSVGIKFDDEVQALLLLSSLPDSWSRTVTAVTGSVGPDGYTFDQIRDLVLGEDVRRKSSGSHLVNCFMLGIFWGVTDIVLKTPAGFWTLKDVKIVLALKKSLISVRQLDEQGHEVKFRDGQWKVVKGNLVMARGGKRGSLYMVELPSEGVTVQFRRKTKSGSQSLVGRIRLSVQERNLEPLVRLRMNEHGKVQGGQSEGRCNRRAEEDYSMYRESWWMAVDDYQASKWENVGFVEAWA
ncbi:unnamed protein product [Cuscuta campestris]|uniref:Retrovirus-related Pol polyprotein from transposon TNT 1-94 n=1 Tax=Cuscuta campestris TaxID=132261 RepID=A0A484M8H8_9ASTE|nr:unnamed protein product [Cuscuta campestris]